ncbi:DUF805 domain-containing protein [Alteromonas hispanica]|uniref:DUF805 domain-containing protein n=1 Tax=Alteromonas hispanica TaxID=315421 RepID=A0A6L9MY37_9ALTE|nr:DUF805 domain-containing protein [Alteromonas hispanica]NDW23134.1 DUF805 domain-containing protein [Alteromonas hispanica]
MEYFTKALKHYADFTGRARRTEYWMFFLFYIIFYVVCATISYALGFEALTAIFSLALLIPSLSVGARRLHDTGRTGWWQLLNLIPIIGTIVLIIFFAQDSSEDNKYGPNPKAAV